MDTPTRYAGDKGPPSNMTKRLLRLNDDVCIKKSIALRPELAAAHMREWLPSDWLACGKGRKVIDSNRFVNLCEICSSACEAVIADLYSSVVPV
jgi:hypothetical protein